MKFTMRRASTLTSSILSRTVSASTVRHRLLTTTSTSTSNARRFWSSTASAPALAGALASVAAVASLSYQEVYAKEPLPADLVPKEVVLYQYEACPFCNKVKGSDL